MNNPGKASLPVIKRLPKYYRYLRTLKNDGITSISSRELAAQMGTTASQVRQDFNCFGGFGQQGIGYKVDVLRAEIGNLLFGDGEKLPTILVGAGRLGSAVSSFISRDANGYKLLGVFDVNPDLIGKEMCGVPILPLSDLDKFCAEHHPEVAVLCVPRQSAMDLAGELVRGEVPRRGGGSELRRDPNDSGSWQGSLPHRLRAEPPPRGGQESKIRSHHGKAIFPIRRNEQRQDYRAHAGRLQL